MVELKAQKVGTNGTHDIIKAILNFLAIRYLFRIS